MQSSAKSPSVRINVPAARGPGTSSDVTEPDISGDIKPTSHTHPLWTAFLSARNVGYRTDDSCMSKSVPWHLCSITVSSRAVRRDSYARMRHIVSFITFPQTGNKFVVFWEECTGTKQTNHSCWSVSVQSVLTVLGRCMWPDMCRIPDHSVTAPFVQRSLCFEAIWSLSTSKIWETIVKKAANGKWDYHSLPVEGRALRCFQLFICQRCVT